MGRTAREKRPPALPKVERVELSGSRLGLRFAAFGLCLALGICALGLGIYGLISTEPGWSKIEADSPKARCAADFSFSYRFGSDATAQRKAITTVYTQECERLTKLFDPSESYEDCPGNLHDVNARPGERVEVDPLLYSTLEELTGREDGTVYRGLENAWRLNRYYEGLDPFGESLGPEAGGLELELLGGNALRLTVPPQCGELAGELGLDCYLDLGWLKNAVILDALCGELSSRGYTQGIITSRDGFTRSLGGDLGPVGLSTYKWEGGRAVEASVEELDTPVNAAALTGFPLPGDDGRAYIAQRVLMGGGALEETLLLKSSGDSCLELALQAAALASKL